MLAPALAEIRFEIELLPDPTRRSDLTDWLTDKVRPMFGRRVLPISEDVMFKWGLLVEGGALVSCCLLSFVETLYSASPRPRSIDLERGWVQSKGSYRDC